MEREFKVGDRVRVNDSTPNIDWFLPRDNRIGTIVSISCSPAGGYELKMEKPIPLRQLVGGVGDYDFFAYPWDIELLEAAKIQEPFNIWSVEPPKVKPQPQNERIPDVWEK